MKKRFTILIAAIAAIIMITQPCKVVGQTRDDVVGTINFGSASGSTKIEGSTSSGTGTVTYTDTGDDNQENTWTITTVTSNTKSFTQNASYSQVGSSSNPVTSITFTMTLPSSQLIKSFSAKFGGFSNTAGTVTLKVGSTTIGSGSLNGTSDVVVENTSTTSGTVLTVTVTGIAKGVKCYYVSYTYPTGGTTYDVNISGSISHGTLSADPDEAIEDATVTLTATPDDGYMANQFTVSKSEGTVSVTKTGFNTGTFTMPAEDVTASVTFVPTHTLSYSATNGSIKFDDGVPAASGSFAFGETLTTSVTANPVTGYQFSGWTVTGEGASVENANATPTTFTMGTEASTLTANFVQVITGTINFGSASGSTSINSTSVTGDDSMGNEWTITTVIAETSFTQNASYSQVGSAKKPATSITFTTTLAESVKIADFTAKFGGFTDTAGDITLKVDGTEVGSGSLSGTSDVIVVNESVEEGSELTVTVTNIEKGVKCYYISFTILTYDYYGTTTITNFTIPVGEKLTVHNGAVLNITGTLTNNATASDLVVEDGGQLIVHNSGVQATIKKALPSGSSKATNWTTIASPVKNISIGDTDEDGDVLHLKDVDYALYRLNETTPEWENYKNDEYHDSGADDFETLEAGRGYLYSRTALETLSYVGEVNGDDYTEYSLTKSSNDNAGFHLIGNPYSHDIYKGATGNGYAIPNTQQETYVDNGYVLAEGFYRLKNGTSWASSLDDGTKIESGEGILVQATTAGTLRIYNSDTKPAPAKGRANNDNIMFTVANSQYDDVAYALFKKGVGLTKINHRNENVPMIYINQDGSDFAIATMSDDTKSFNLNFKAMTTGMYKLGLKPEGNFTYIHVIDKLTGEDIDMLLEGEYNFIGSPKDSENRFIVRLGYMPNSNEDSNDIFAYQSGSEIYVTGSGELQIFDVTGRRVMTTTINGSESINIPNQGVYIFRLNEKVQKIVVR